MGIKLTNPLVFDSQKPNFERDVIDTATGFTNVGKLVPTNQAYYGSKYDVGHIVWDVYTQKNYRFEYSGGSYYFAPLEPLAMATQDWYDLVNNNTPYIPKSGEIVIFTDYRSVNGVNVPSFKVGDGVHNTTELPFVNTPYAETSGTAERVAHKLYIGPHEYDGSAEVHVGVYVDSDLLVDDSDWEVN